MRVDEDGQMWETFFDLANLDYSAFNMIKNPSWGNFGYLAWDAGATMLPFVPGSYTAKVVKVAGKSSSGVKSTTKVASSVCFTEETLILTKDGNKPIKEIKVGDEVYSYNEETGEVDVKPVVQTFVNETDELIHVKVYGQTINTTNDHPFYVPEIGWTEASKLRAGDKLLLQNGKVVMIEVVEREVLDIPVKVYNFEVADWHTYYVSKNSVLVHNECSAGGLKNIYNSIKVAPKYPKEFKAIQGGLKKVNINNGDVFDELIKVESGRWKKVYKDGYDASGRKISIHYFESLSGKVFDVKVKQGWSVK